MSAWVKRVAVVGVPVAIFGATFAILHLPVTNVIPPLGDLPMVVDILYSLLAAGPLLLVGPAGILLLVLSFFRRFRSSRPFAFFFILCGAATVLAWWLAWGYRTAAFKELTHRAEPLVQAIETYRRDKGSYPESLEELAPHYIERIPGTGMAGYPQFFYERRQGEEKAANRDSFELQVPCGQLMGFDVFVYWPEGNYPEYMYGGGVQEIGGWAYVHE